ncbi:hypothetical protein [Allochromatium vinosum]|uniref:hypothetical protein n=1 Tax=Allochromatium vinosum TaxID=1049 RepID=UPI001902E115|nr:hypothetical protein [Allochromatium vinosum]
MRFIAKLVLTIIITFNVASAAADAEWWAIATISGRCVEDDGPAAFIKNHRALGLPYTAKDLEENGVIVQTTIQSPSFGTQITYFRGKLRCERALSLKERDQQQEIEKYH